MDDKLKLYIKCKLTSSYKVTDVHYTLYVFFMFIKSTNLYMYTAVSTSGINITTSLTKYINRMS